MSQLTKSCEAFRAGSIRKDRRQPRFSGGLETLEARRFLSVTQVSFADFNSTTNLVGNGFGGAPINNGAALRMTDGIDNEARSVWFGTKVPVNTFSTSFDFQSNNDATSADGITFTVQNNDTAALGLNGGNLGYRTITNSVAVAFNIYNIGGFGSFFGFTANGQRPPTNTDLAPLDLHNGDVYTATVTYDGRHLDVSLTDKTTPGSTFTARKNLNIPTLVGADTAFVGFTAATGVENSTQDILNWSYAGTNFPTVSVVAAADPNPVTSRTSVLSVLGTDSAGESGLTYTWSVTKKPTGAKDPTFSINADNDSKETTARFYKDGTYRFRVTLTNASGGSVFSNVAVTVVQRRHVIRMTPHKQTVQIGGTIDYNAAVLDQFNHLMRSAQPLFTYSLLQGDGQIDADSGLFRAGTTKGHIVVAAEALGLTGTVGGTVTG